MLPRRLAAGLVLAAVALATAAARPAFPQGASAPDAFGIRLVDVPTERADDPRARTYVVDHLDNGSTIERRVEVSNNTPNPLSLALYAGAASVGDGEFAFGDDRAANELTSWTSVEPGSMNLAPGEASMATVKIVVPENAASGEHYGVVWAEARADATSGGLSTANRVGVRMYVSVGAGGEPPSDFEIRTMTAGRDGQGRPRVEASIQNTGQRALDLSGHLDLSAGPGGLTAGPFTMELGTTLAPGETAPATVLLDAGLPDGPWMATVTVRSGTLEKRAQAEIRFPHERARSAAPVRAKSLGVGGADLLRLLLAGVITVLVTGGLFLLLLARRRRRRPTDQRAGQGDATPPTAARPRRVRRPEPGQADRPRTLQPESDPEPRVRSPQGRGARGSAARRRRRPTPRDHGPRGSR